MVVDLKPYLYSKGTDLDLDAQFAQAKKYGKVRLSPDVLFWRAAFRQYALPLSQVRQIRRGISTVIGRLCAGGRNYDMEYLVILLKDGSELTVHIVDSDKELALELVSALKAGHPEISFSKD